MVTDLKKLKAGVAAVIMAAGLGAPVTAADQCAHDVERAALDLRVAQTQLMVAALSCPATSKPLLQAAYNRFVTVEEGALKRSKPLLQAYLKRSRIGTLDTFVTELANDIALEAALRPDFCTAARAAVETVGARDGMLPAALPFAEWNAGLEDCAMIYAGSEGSDRDPGPAPVVADNN